MRRMVLAAAAAVAFMGPALAQSSDEPIPQWNGPYILNSPGLFLSGSEEAEAQAALQPHAADLDGAIAGFIGGTNIQAGNWVFGVEGDRGWTGAATAGQLLDSGEPLPSGFDDVAHLRGRAGVASGDNLFYIAGGLAIADQADHAPATGVEAGKGWTLGVGIERNFSQGSFGRLEYLRDDFGGKDSCEGQSPCDDNASLTAQVLRAVFGLKF